MNLSPRTTFADRLADKLFGWDLTDVERRHPAAHRPASWALKAVYLAWLAYALLMFTWVLGFFGLLPMARENFSELIGGTSFIGGVLVLVGKAVEARVVRKAIADHEANSPQ